MVGERFGLLTIVSQADSTKAGKRRWLCLCDCGNETVAIGSHLRTGNTKSCGCLRHETYTPEVVHPGDRFGRLVVREEAGRNRRRERAWLCDCDCGAVHMTTTAQLMKGGTKSCGCLRDERTAAAHWKHGAAASVSRGQRRRAETPEYRAWCTMKTRCFNPRSSSYPRYGGRGIVVCDRWRDSFPNFLADMGEKPGSEYSIDRIDVDGNYEPGNCRWATAKEQRANQRRSPR